MIGPNGIVYTVATQGGTIYCSMWSICRGTLIAYRLEGGEKLWSRDFDMPANIFPAVGRLGPGKGLSVVLPVGQQAGIPRGIVLGVISALAAFLGLALAVLASGLHCAC